jgi:hypothetical protein
MIRNDYILRLVEQIRSLAGRITELEKKGLHADSLAAIEELVRQHTGMNSRTVLSLSHQDFAALLAARHVSTIDQLVITAVLLKLEAEAYASLAEMWESRRRDQRALDLLLDVALSKTVTNLEEFLPGIDEIAARYPAELLETPTRQRLLHYWEASGRYALAEDRLFEWLEENPGDFALLAEGLAYYRRLLERTDEVLTAGGLPRPEVEEGLAELEERAAKRRPG